MEDNITLYEYRYFSNGNISLKRLTTEYNKLVVKQKQLPSNNSHMKNIFSIVKDILENAVIENEYYKIESNKLIINPTRLFNSYYEYFQGTQIILLSKTDFFKSLKTSPEFVEYKSSVRFKKNNTSAFIFKM